MKKYIIFLSLLAIISCGSGENKNSKVIVLKGIDNNDSVKEPLPLVLRGYIKGYDSIVKKSPKRLYIYIYEKDIKEKQWHVDSITPVKKDGKFKARTWLGNKKLGNGGAFKVCAVLTQKKIRIKSRNPRAKYKIKGIAETCISLKRKD
jgi:hypothetical protein